MSVIFFFENNAGKEKRSVEYCLFINEFCHNEGGRIPSTSEPTSLYIIHNCIICCSADDILFMVLCRSHNLRTWELRELWAAEGGSSSRGPSRHSSHNLQSQCGDDNEDVDNPWGTMTSVSVLILTILIIICSLAAILINIVSYVAERNSNCQTGIFLRS